MASIMLAVSFGNAGYWIKVAGIVVIVAAILFAGHRMVFAKKRFSDVAPVLICAFLLAAAGEIIQSKL